jgi:1,2-diacylglycerol 3-alpha-glucosyltransferase
MMLETPHASARASGGIRGGRNDSVAIPVAFLVQRLGPYHHARLNAWAASRQGGVSVIEFRSSDRVYAWDAVKTGGAAYRRVSTGSRDGMIRALDEISPQVVVCTGYADVEIHQALAWALSRGVPVVTCSDSTFDDEPRSWAREKFKRAVVGSFGAALVAGTRAHKYMEHLGLEGRRCFQPWDVVDNFHFADGADRSRSAEADFRTRLKLPASYFLCVARFVPKKNLRRLIEAYAGYVAQAGTNAWSLVLSGAGPLESALRAQVAAAGLAARVHFPGFLQYPDLPACYGLAGAFVLPSVSDQWGLVVNEAMAAGLPVLVSSRCGCAPDLVRDGENGCTFDPENTAALADHLGRMAGCDAERRAAMGRRSREIVDAFSPAAFARGLESAIACATRSHRPARSLLRRALIGALAMRSPPRP